jgi:hypothetical protein
MLAAPRLEDNPHIRVGKDPGAGPDPKPIRKNPHRAHADWLSFSKPKGRAPVLRARGGFRLLLLGPSNMSVGH